MVAPLRDTLVSGAVHRPVIAGGHYACLLYAEIFKQLEAVRSNMDRDIPWASMNAIT